MKNILISFFLMVLTTTFSETLKAQNLVPNPSFEDTMACPNGFDQIDRAVGWSSYRSTGDYFNSCAALASHVSVPSNPLGFRYARTGNAYAGFVAWTGGHTECIGVQLNQTLIIGQKYFASFYVTRAASHNDYNAACNKIGMRLSTISYSITNPVPIDNHAQVFTDSIITDTLNWVKISGSFIADSAYRYLSIGRFDSLVSVTIFDTISQNAYYFVDDVCLSTDSLLCNNTGEAVYENINNSFIKLFPNPAHDIIEIDGNNVQSVILSDIFGRIVYISSSELVSPIKINTSSLSRGIYILKANKQNNTIINKIILN